MPTTQSPFVKMFNQSLHGKDKIAQDNLWEKLRDHYPIIEDISGKSEKLVTFLYRMQPEELDGKTSIYFLSGVTGYTFDEHSQLKVIPGTDIAYISLTLPLQLRTGYNLARVHNTNRLEEQVDFPSTYPRLIGEDACFDALLGRLHAEKRIILDPLNDDYITYYKDMDKQDEFYAMESILELEEAPSLPEIPISCEAAKIARDQLRQAGRLIQGLVNFSDTSLKDLPDYLSASRKYWIYLPPNYQKETTSSYPLMLFLDGSQYLDYIPAHVYLEHMIENREIPPCVGIFLDYADGPLRTNEYNCNDHFTQFLCFDFLADLRKKHHLNMTTDPNRSTIIGTSYSGLAAFYVALSRPEIFGHCIAQSPAVVAQPLSKIERMIQDAAHQGNNATFSFEMGSYENNIIQLEYADGTIQSCSSLEVVRHIYEQMQREGLEASLHEFIGGHNSICWQVSLYDRIKEVFHKKLNFEEQNTHCSVKG